MKIRNRRLIRAAAWCLVKFFRVLFWTCRIEYHAVDPKAMLDYTPDPVDRERFVLCTWHDQLLFPSFSCAHPELACCLVSQHSDASFLSDALEMLGCRAVRGSSRRGGVAAVRQIIRDSDGCHIMITPDGPIGPRQKMKAGPIYLASETNRKLVAGGYSCRSGWRIPGKWTDMLIPRPFTKVYVVTGRTMYVPPDLSREELDAWVERAQREMDDVQRISEELAGHRPKTVTAPPQPTAKAA